MAARMPLALAVLVLVAPALAKEKVSPIESVLTMLQELQEKVVQEGRKEAKTYDKFACFCKETAEFKAEDITVINGLKKMPP